MREMEAGMTDGCRRHAVSAASVSRRWRSVVAMIDRAPADDNDAQWSAVAYCHCCLGPCRNTTATLCSECAGGDGCGTCARGGHV